MAMHPRLKPGIVLHRFSQPTFPLTETVEVTEDRFVLSLPLCRGSVRLETEGRTIYDGAVRPGMLRIAAPGERLRVQRRSRAEAVIISVAGPLFRRIAAEQDYRGDRSALSFVAPIVTPDPQVARLTTSLLGLGAVDASQQRLFLEGVTYALLALAFSPRRTASEAGQRRGLSDAEFARCIDFADAHLDTKVDLASWAQALGLPTSEFVRRFQHTAQVPPYAWFLNWRIDRAMHLLGDPEASLAAVALQVGFSSQSHFTEAFRRRTGVSPARWRMQMPAGSR